MNRINRDKCLLVLIQHDFLEFIELQTRDDAVEDFLRLARVTARAVQEGDAAPEAFVEGGGHLLVLVRDDHDGVGLVEPLEHDVNHLCNDEVCKERVHSFIPTIQQPCRTQDKEVDEHDDLADGELRPRIEDDGDDLRAVERAARTHDDADPEPRHDAPEDRGEERIARHRRDGMQNARPHGEHDDGKDRRERKTLADLLVPHVDERDIVDDEERAERHARDGVRHDRKSDDAAVDDVVRNEEQLEPRRGDERADDEHQHFFHIKERAVLRLAGVRILCSHKSSRIIYFLIYIIEERKTSGKSAKMKMVFLTLPLPRYIIAV